MNKLHLSPAQIEYGIHGGARIAYENSLPENEPIGECLVCNKPLYDDRDYKIVDGDKVCYDCLQFMEEEIEL